MKHGLKQRKLNRESSHRKALLANLAISLIEHEQIKTTLAKAKELKPYTEKLITLAKKGDLASRKRALSRLNNNNQAVKNISVDPDGQFNNIIFLEVDDKSQTLITATANKIVSISPQEVLSEDYEIRDLILKNQNIYLATIDGKIIKLSLDLNELASKKFKYSKIHSLGFNNGNVYAIESQGYAIKLSQDFKKEEILEFDFDNNDRMIVIEDKLYFSDEYITLP